MQKIGMFEAKTHLPEIIRNVENGQEYCLTKRGGEVAFVISVEQYYKGKNAAVFSELEQLKKRAPLGQVDEIINMRDAGRK